MIGDVSLFLENITIEDLSSFLEHPFVLLIAGALISSIAVTALTQKWQDRKSQFDVKVSLVNEISETSTLIIAALMSKIDGTVDREKEEKAIIESKKIEANLYSYFPDGVLSDEWREYTVDFMKLWYIATYLNTKQANKDFKDTIEQVKKYVTKTFPDKNVEWGKIINDFDQDQFLTVRTIMFNHYQHFVKKVTKSKAVIF